MLSFLGRGTIHPGALQPGDVVMNSVMMEQIDFLKEISAVVSKRLAQCDDIENIASEIYSERMRFFDAGNTVVTCSRTTASMVYATIAVYKAVLEITGDADLAFNIVDTYFTQRAKEEAHSIQKICRIPFAYKTVPGKILKKIQQECGPGTGFETKLRRSQPGYFHVDIVVCPIKRICYEEECKELVDVFCNIADVAIGDVNPHLSWERTMTRGRGDKYCNFILRVED